MLLFIILNTFLLSLNKFAIVCECYYLNWQLLSYHHISSTFQTQTLHWPTLLCYAIPCSAFSLPCFGLLCCFALRFSFSGVPYAALLCPTLVYLLSSALLLCPALACPTLLYSALPYASLLFLALICPDLFCSALPYSYSSALLCITLPWFALPYPTLLCPPLLCSALPYPHRPALLLRALPCSARLCPALLCPALFCATPLPCYALLCSASHCFSAKLTLTRHIIPCESLTLIDFIIYLLLIVLVYLLIDSVSFIAGVSCVLIALIYQFKK